MKVSAVFMISILSSKNSDQDTPRIGATTLPYSTISLQPFSSKTHRRKDERTEKDQWDVHKREIYLMTNALGWLGIFLRYFKFFSI